MNAKLNKRERRAAALLAHYATCEALARHLGMTKPDGKKISVALWKIERDAHNAATAQCNGKAYQGQPYREYCDGDGNECENSPLELFADDLSARVAKVFGGKLPPGFFWNRDPRGCALKLAANSVPVALQTDWGGYQLLSPEITGD